MNRCTERLYNGLIKENPTFVLMLGMCPTLAVTTSAINGIGMGLSTTVVLVLSNMLISMLRKIIPDSVRMPAFIVVVASFVTIVQFLLEGFDGIGMGLGFTAGLTSIGIVRELIGSGKIFNFQVLPDTYEPITIFILAPGAFFVLAGLTALQNKIKNRAQKKGKPVNNNDGCAGGCASCAGCGSAGTKE